MDGGTDTRFQSANKFPLPSFAVKRELNRKDAKKYKIRKVQFHAVYGLFPLFHACVFAELCPIVSFCRLFSIFLNGFVRNMTITVQIQPLFSFQGQVGLGK